VAECRGRGNSCTATLRNPATNIGRTDGVDPPPPQAAWDSIVPHLNFFWSSYEERVAPLLRCTLTSSPIFNGHRFRQVSFGSQ
jgi:hypothetical protein